MRTSVKRQRLQNSGWRISDWGGSSPTASNGCRGGDPRPPPNTPHTPKPKAEGVRIAVEGFRLEDSGYRIAVG